MKKIFIIILIILLILPLILSSQSEEEKIDNYLSKGLKLYEDEKYEEAIAEWEKIFEIDLEHPKALSYIKQARYKLKKKKEKEKQEKEKQEREKQEKQKTEEYLKEVIEKKEEQPEKPWEKKEYIFPWRIMIALTGAYSYIANSDFNDYADSWVEFGEDIYKSVDMDFYEVNAEAVNSALSGNIELQIMFLPKMIIGIGAGYFFLPVSTFENRYDDGVFGSWHNIIEMEGKVIPLSFSGYYIISGNENFNLNVGAGIEYYMGSFSMKNTKKEADGVPWELGDPLDYSGSGIGICLKFGGEFKINDFLSFLTGISARYGKISGFEGDIKQFDGSTAKEKLYSFDQYMDDKTYHLWTSLTDEQKISLENDPDVSNFKEAEIILHGIMIYIGMGIKF